MTEVSMIRVKEMLQYDESFRSKFPDLKSEIDDFLKDPACPCHASLYREILSRIKQNPPARPTGAAQAFAAACRFLVVNCNVDNLEKELRKLPVGSNVEGITRFENEITCVVKTKE